MNRCDTYKKNENESSACISVNVCCFLTEMNPFHILISSMSNHGARTLNKQHLSAARSGFFLKLWTHFPFFYPRLLTREGAPASNSDPFFFPQNDLDSRPSRRSVSKSSIKSVLFPGAIKSFQGLPAALTLAPLFPAFNVANSGI